MTVLTYTLGDFLIRIKNAAIAGNKDVEVRKTKLLVSVSKVLKDLGYLDEVSEDGTQLNVRLKFSSKRPVLTNIKLVSKPGLRVYKGVNELKQYKKPAKLIISTPYGVMGNDSAVKKNIGGEILAEVL